MKITIVSNGLTHSTERDTDDLDIFEVAEMFRCVLSASGFMTETIDKILPSDEKLEELHESNEIDAGTI